MASVDGSYFVPFTPEERWRDKQMAFVLICISVLVISLGVASTRFMPTPPRRPNIVGINVCIFSALGVSYGGVLFGNRYDKKRLEDATQRILKGEVAYKVGFAKGGWRVTPITTL